MECEKEKSSTLTFKRKTLNHLIKYTKYSKIMARNEKLNNKRINHRSTKQSSFSKEETRYKENLSKVKYAPNLKTLRLNLKIKIMIKELKNLKYKI